MAPITDLHHKKLTGVSRWRPPFLQIFAIDKTMRATGELSHFEQAALQESRLLRETASHRAQGMSHPRHFFR